MQVSHLLSLYNKVTITISLQRELKGIRAEIRSRRSGKILNLHFQVKQNSNGCDCRIDVPVSVSFFSSKDNIQFKQTNKNHYLSVNFSNAATADKGHCKFLICPSFYLLSRGLNCHPLPSILRTLVSVLTKSDGVDKISILQIVILTSSS